MDRSPGATDVELDPAPLVTSSNGVTYPREPLFPARTNGSHRRCLYPPCKPWPKPG